jgi:glycosyltransferase involved in cell wall biosynthesis
MSVTRLLFVSNSARGEYTGRYRWIEALRGRGYEVSFVVPPREPWHADRIARSGARVHTYAIDPQGIDPARELKSASDLARILRREDPHVVHSFGHKANVHCIAATQRARRPALVLHVTGLGSPFQPRARGIRDRWTRAALRTAYRIGARRASRILFMNPEDRDAFAFVARDRTAICSSGVDADEFDPRRVDSSTRTRLRRELSLAPDDRVLTFVGRLLPEKGIAELAEAVDRLRTTPSQVILLLVGPEDAARPLRGRLESDRVRVLGRREDVRDILAITDVFVNPSYYREGLPRVNLEAAAMGVPLVTTDVPGCRQLPSQAPCGTLVPPGNVEALAHVLADLLAAPDRRRQMGRAGRSLVCERYTVERVVDELDAIYRAVLEEDR